MKFNSFILLFLIPLFVNAQKSVTTNYKPKQLIFDGNSLFSRGNGNTANSQEASIACYAAMTGSKPPIFNYGVSGKSITQLISDFPTKIAPYLRRGDILVFNEMTNDLATNTSTLTTKNDLLQYRDSVRAHGAKFIVVTMTARNTGYAGIETDRLALNAWINANTSEFDGIVDAGGDSHFNSIAATANTTYYNADTLHFATAGYTLYGQLIQALIQQFFN